MGSQTENVRTSTSDVKLKLKKENQKPDEKYNGDKDKDKKETKDPPVTFVGGLVVEYAIYYKAILARTLFGTHALVTVWRTAVLMGDAYWALAFGVIFLAAEYCITMWQRMGEEWPWISWSTLCYLLSVTSSLWVQKLESLGHVTSLNGSTIASIPGLNTQLDFSAADWLLLTEQTMMVTIILSRWLLPKGEMTHTGLSTLLLLYLGLSADILDFTTIFNEPKIAKDEVIVYIILVIWTGSLCQFFIVLTNTQEASEDTGGLKGVICSSEVWQILVQIGLQDCPFLLIRVLALLQYEVFNYTIIFFVCKNTLVISLEVYHLVGVCKDQRARLKRRRERMATLKAKMTSVKDRVKVNAITKALKGGAGGKGKFGFSSLISAAGGKTGQTDQSKTADGMVSPNPDSEGGTTSAKTSTTETKPPKVNPANKFLHLGKNKGLKSTKVDVKREETDSGMSDTTSIKDHPESPTEKTKDAVFPPNGLMLAKENNPLEAPKSFFASKVQKGKDDSANSSSFNAPKGDNSNGAPKKTALTKMLQGQEGEATTSSEAPTKNAGPSKLLQGGGPNTPSTSANSSDPNTPDLPEAPTPVVLASMFKKGGVNAPAAPTRGNNSSEPSKPPELTKILDKDRKSSTPPSSHLTVSYPTQVGRKTPAPATPSNPLFWSNDKKW